MSSLSELSFASVATNDTERRFYDRAQRFYEARFERFPTQASDAGLRQFDSELGRADRKTFRDELDSVEATLAELENLPEHEFGPDGWLDRRCLLAELRTERMRLRTTATWRTNPNRHANAAVDSLLSLVIRNAESLAKVAPALESRLRQIPRYLDDAASVLKNPVPLWAELAVKTCAAVPGFLDTLTAELTSVSATPREELARLIGDARRAFARFGRAVERCDLGHKDGYSLGRKRFERLIAERLGMTVTAREATAMGRALVTKLRAELDAEVRKISPGKSAAEVLDEARRGWSPTAGDLLSEYQQKTQQVRDRFAAADAVGFPPGESLLVKLVPEFLAHEIPTAAYLQPGAFDSSQVGIFWVNDLSRFKTEPADKAREVAQHYGLELTCGHEAYPGHHLQFCMANRHPSRLRRLFAHAVYYEGWTLWCEQLMVDLKIEDSPFARIQQLHDALWRAYRILIDCGLHTGELDVKAAVRVLTEGVGFTEARASAELNWYTQSPTVPMSYLIGKYENLRLRRKLVEGAGWSLRKFNDWLLSWGTVPQRWIELAASA